MAFASFLNQIYPPKLKFLTNDSFKSEEKKEIFLMTTK